MSAITADSMSGLLAFVRAAEARSYVSAGRALGVTSSAIGKSVTRLEEKLGVRLFHRSTRSINLTAEGELFFERCQRILTDLGDAECELSRTKDAPRGRVRVSVPAACHYLLSPILPDFTRRYPEIELDIDYDDRLVDVIDEGFDVVLRSGELADSRLKSRKVASFSLVIVASPSYLRLHGTPKRPSDLAHHDCLLYRFPTTGKIQHWAVGDDVQPRAVMICNSVEALIGAAREGMGLACLPDFAVRRAIAQEKLVCVLPSIPAASGDFRLLWPVNRFLSPKVCVLIEFLTERLRGKKRNAERRDR